MAAEVGINHDGSAGIAQQLIEATRTSCCDVVNREKRTIDVVYAAAELAHFRETPFAETNAILKHAP